MNLFRLNLSLKMRVFYLLVLQALPSCVSSKDLKATRDDLLNACKEIHLLRKESKLQNCRSDALACLYLAKDKFHQDGCLPQLTICLQSVKEDFSEDKNTRNCSFVSEDDT